MVMTDTNNVVVEPTVEVRRCSINEPGRHGGQLVEKDGALICELHINPVPYCMVEADSPHGGGKLVQVAANSYVCPNHTRPTNPGLVKAMSEIATTAQEAAPDFKGKPPSKRPRQRQQPRTKQVEDETEQPGYRTRRRHMDD